MKSEKLEQALQKLSDALSGFDDALTDLQMKSVPSPNMADIQRCRLLSEIDSNTSQVSTRIGEIGEKIELLKSFEGITSPKSSRRHS